MLVPIYLFTVYVPPGGVRFRPCPIRKRIAPFPFCDFSCTSPIRGARQAPLGILAPAGDTRLARAASRGKGPRWEYIQACSVRCQGNCVAFTLAARLRQQQGRPRPTLLWHWWSTATTVLDTSESAGAGAFSHQRRHHSRCLLGLHLLLASRYHNA